jgi:hypothetical protein
MPTVASAGAGGTSPVAGAGGTLGSAGAAPGGGAGNSGSGVGGGGANTSGGTGGQASGGVAFATSRVVVTGVRDIPSAATPSPPAQSVITLHNGGSAPAQVASLAISGPNATLFQITSPTAFPAMVAPGADLAVTVELTTKSGGALPAPPANKDFGSVLLTGTLTATLGSGAVTASVYGLVLTLVNYEPTLGQILTTLGYELKVGQAQDNWNPNTTMDATNLPGIEAGTDEVAASHFVKAGTGNVGMVLVARFSPVGLLPYGWYTTTTGCPAGCTTVGSMAMVTDAQTSDKARMVYPPLAAGTMTSFDPGTAPFGLWVYSDQTSQNFKEGGNKVNGDYDYSQDALNSPLSANGIHRFKSYPLKDASGTAIPHNYLVAIEEAGNGDYQDYVFVLSNVTAMP